MTDGPRYVLRCLRAPLGCPTVWAVEDTRENVHVVTEESYAVACRVEARLNGTDSAGRAGCREYGEPEEVADDYLSQHA